MRRVRNLASMGALSTLLALLACSGDDGPTTPAPTPPPTASPPTTTTTPPSSTVNYAQDIHPIWESSGCNNGACHNGAARPTLTGTASQSCNDIADRDEESPRLILGNGNERLSWLLNVPETGTVGAPDSDAFPHDSGASDCFAGPGSACYDLVLQWLQEGANGPEGTVCRFEP